MKLVSNHQKNLPSLDGYINTACDLMIGISFAARASFRGKSSSDGVAEVQVHKFIESIAVSGSDFHLLFIVVSAGFDIVETVPIDKLEIPIKPEAVLLIKVIIR